MLFRVPAARTPTSLPPERLRRRPPSSRRSSLSQRILAGAVADADGGGGPLSQRTEGRRGYGGGGSTGGVGAAAAYQAARPGWPGPVAGVSRGGCARREAPYRSSERGSYLRFGLRSDLGLAAAVVGSRGVFCGFPVRRHGGLLVCSNKEVVLRFLLAPR